MVTLKWGDALSLLLPGVLALFALSLFVLTPERSVKWFGDLSPTAGAGLVVVAAVLGGVLEGVTRIGWDRYVLPPPPNVLPVLRADNNLDLYERGVQNSYKWATFYANSATAIVLIGVGLLVNHWLYSAIASFGVAVLMFCASYTQWSYFCNYLQQVFVDGRSGNARK